MTHFWSNAIDILCWVLVLPTLVFLAFRSYGRSDDRRGLVRRWIISAALLLIIQFVMWLHSPFTIFFALLPAVALGFLWLPSVASILVRPLTGILDGGGAEGEVKPFYFIAEGKRRKGLYEEAMAEVRKQLGMFPGDYEGYMKLAGIQMEDLQDLPAAQATLNEFLELM